MFSDQKDGKKNAKISILLRLLDSVVELEPVSASNWPILNQRYVSSNLLGDIRSLKYQKKILKWSPAFYMSLKNLQQRFLIQKGSEALETMIYPL